MSALEVRKTIAGELMAAGMGATKDKTMVHILDTLARLENKFDNMSIRTPPASALDLRSLTNLSSPLSSHATTNSVGGHTHRDPGDNTQQDYQHLTVPHMIMLWPGIYIHLINSGIAAASDMQYVLQEGTLWFIKREMANHPEPLASDIGLPCFPVGQAEAGRMTNVAFPTLTIQQIQEYSDAYFNTFNVLYPVLSRESFMNDIVARLLREGYAGGDSGSVLALLVFALGQVAIEGVFDRPISVVNGQPSGFRGGSLLRPPGLALFNEARRRIGFIASQCTLENVQVLLLQATYYESTARHLDYWRSTVAASMACQVLVRCKVVDWESPAGDLIKRVYWTCVLREDLYHLDLDLPQTGIHTLEDEVPLPYFHENQRVPEEDASGGASMSSMSSVTAGGDERERSHFQYHFLAMIALRRLIARIHHVIHECEQAMQAEPLWQGTDPLRGARAHPPFAASFGQPEGSEEYSGPPTAVVREMIRQLDSWRALLPRPLQWNDNDKYDFPTADPISRRPTEPLFVADQGPIPIGHRYNLDIVTAQLRTRFYYARFMIYRLFVYKALHFPELMTQEDYNLCALAIKSACVWPLAMAPPKNKKRLVPHLFAWTQNFVGILLVLKMCSENDILKSIVDDGGVVGRQEIDNTISLLLDWVRDAKQMDGIADWAWNILEPLFFGGN